MATVEEAVLRVKVDPAGAVKGGKDAQAALDKVSESAKHMADSVSHTEGVFHHLGETLSEMKGLVLGALGGLAAAEMIHKAVEEVTQYEDALVAVTRVTHFSAEETATFTEAVDAAVTSLPLAEKGIMDVARAAAEMGVHGAEELAKFSITMEELGKITGYGGTEAARSLLQLFAVTGTSIEKTDAYASTLVKLQNTTRATAADISELGLKIASKGKQFNISAADASAFAASMASMGAEGRFAVTGIVDTMDLMRDAIKKNGPELANMGTLMGMTGKQVKEAFDSNSSDALVMLVRGLRDANTSGIPFTKTLAAIGDSGNKILQVVPAMAAGVDSFGTALKAARSEMESGTTLQKQMEDTSKTLGSRFTILTSTINQAYEESKAFSGALKDIVDFSAGVIRSLFGLQSEAAKTTTAMDLVANTIRGVVAGMTAFAALSVGQVLLELATSASAASRAMTILNIVMDANPIGLVAAAIGILIGLYYQFKDVTFSVGESTLSVSDVVLGVMDHYVEKFTFVLDTIILALSTAWTSVFGIVKSGYTWLTGVLDKFLGKFQIDWKGALQTVFDWSIFLINRLLGSVSGLYYAIKTMLYAVIDGFKALGNFDPSDAINSSKKVVEELKKALDPNLVGGRMKVAFLIEFYKDWVGAATKIGGDIAQGLSEGLEANPGLKEWLTNLNRLFGTGEIGNIADKIKARRDARTGVGRDSTGGSEFADPEFYAKNPLSSTSASPGINPATQFSETSKEALKARKSINDLFDSLDAERKEMLLYAGDQQKLTDARELDDAAVKMQTLTEEVYKDNIVAQSEVVRAYIDVLKQTQQARISSAAALKLTEMDKSLEDERRLLGLSSNERERATLVTNYHAEALKVYAGNVSLADADTRIFERHLKELQSDRNLVDMFQEMGQAMSNAFTDAAFAGKSLQDVLKSLIEDLTKIALNRLVMAPLMGQFGNFLNSFGTSADGSVYESGRVTKFAKGGVVSQPTMFALGGGGTGLMGEAGPEAIMPLDRDASGKLGVRGGGKGVTINVYTKDAGSFRDSRSQLMSQVQRLTR